MIAMTVRTTQLYEKGTASMGMIAMTKAWVTARARETVALGRELMGGNGIILSNHVMKQFIDMEGIYTYEGTYDINTLLAGREITGLAAFK